MKNLKYIFVFCVLDVLGNTEVMSDIPENLNPIKSMIGPEAGMFDYFKTDPLAFAAVTAGAGYLIGDNNNEHQINLLNKKVNRAKLAVMSLKPQYKSVIHDIEVKINNTQRAMDLMEQDFVQRINELATVVTSMKIRQNYENKNIAARIKRITHKISKRQKLKERKIKKKILLLKRKLRNLNQIKISKKRNIKNV